MKGRIMIKKRLARRRRAAAKASRARGISERDPVLVNNRPLIH